LGERVDPVFIPCFTKNKTDTYLGSENQLYLLLFHHPSWDPTGQIYESGTPQDALAKLRDIESIDIITLDQNIDRRINGMDLVPKICSIKPDSQIIMITSDPDPELEKRAIQCGLEFMYKPINRDKLKKFFVT
jgi:two-component SAPR family response regulator